MNELLQRVEGAGGGLDELLFNVCLMDCGEEDDDFEKSVACWDCGMNLLIVEMLLFDDVVTVEAVLLFKLLLQQLLLF